MERKLFIRKQANACLELLKGHTPEQRDNWSNATKAVEELAGFILELTNESPTPIPTNYNAIAEQLYPVSMVESDPGRVEYDENVLEREAFLKGASMQQLWVPVESGLPPEIGIAEGDKIDIRYKDLAMPKTITITDCTPTYFKSFKISHWRYHTGPGSNTNPIIEQWGKMRKALGTISKWEFAADGRKFNGNHKEVVKEITGIATEALK
jgi:hypothetical protein